MHTPTPLATTAAPHLGALIPQPVSVEPGRGYFTLTPASQICVEPGTAELIAIGQFLASKLQAATGYALPVQAVSGAPAPGHLYLTTVNADPALGEEGYALTITSEAITLAAYQPAGLFRGLQTLRQLLPPEIESAAVQAGPWTLAAGVIADYPRFAWRGVMLDVSRHFFTVAEVKRYIDLLAGYKINRFHLHLTDDQGWRLMSNAWPNLARYGGSTEVGDGPGGYYTQAEYAEIVAYAQSRYILVVPEIDVPGHTNAALAAYAELNCSGVAPARYTGTKVGFSSLCIDKDLTYTFLEDVIREVAALTPGPYIHIGGDEAQATPDADYIRFVERAQAIVQAQGKQVVGWEEIAQARLLPSTLVQLWHKEVTPQTLQPGAQVILSPAAKTYLDMKYDQTTLLGLDWAGYIDLPTAYNWDPATFFSDLPETQILGVEAPLWSETLRSLADLEWMAFPRVLSLAEIGWSPAASRDWNTYRLRQEAHGPRLAALGVNYYRPTNLP